MSTINYETGLPYMSSEVLAAYSHSAEQEGLRRKDRILQILGAVVNYAEHCISVTPLMDDPDYSKDAEFEEAIQTRDRLWATIKELLERNIPE